MSPVESDNDELSLLLYTWSMCAQDFVWHPRRMSWNPGIGAMLGIRRPFVKNDGVRAYRGRRRPTLLSRFRPAHRPSCGQRAVHCFCSSPSSASTPRSVSRRAKIRRNATESPIASASTTRRFRFHKLEESLKIFNFTAQKSCPIKCDMCLRCVDHKYCQPFIDLRRGWVCNEWADQVPLHERGHTFAL